MFFNELVYLIWFGLVLVFIGSLYLTIVTLLPHFIKFRMYNVRIIDYPSGCQVIVHKSLIDSGGVVIYDQETGQVIDRRKNVGVPVDVWLDSNVDFDSLVSDECRDPEASLRASMRRSKKQIYYLARSNVWEWFVTLTLDGKKIDRYDFENASKKVRKWFENIKRRKAPDLYYLIVPEQHKDGAWHFHGLLGGCDGLSLLIPVFWMHPVTRYITLRIGRLGFLRLRLCKILPV